MSCLALLLATSLVAPQADSSVRVFEENGDRFCDIQARDVEVHHLATKLARELDLRLEGFEDVEESQRVNVILEGRPVNQAIEYVLGAAGLGARVTTDRIEVRGELPPHPTAEDAFAAAEIAYLRTLQRYPESSQAADARLELAEINLAQGIPERAVRHYELLVERSPESEHSDRARMAAGRLLVELEEWGRAQPHFERLADIEISEATSADLIPMISEARLELARCILHRGEARRAQYMLQGLEHAIPARDDHERAARWLLLSRALLELGQGEEGIRYLDHAMSLGTGVVGEYESMDLRARGMELANRPLDASVAWLHWSRNQSPQNQRKALARAAQLALSVEGEELSVLFIHRIAVEAGCGDALLPFANEARSRLGLEAESYANATPTIRLERGEQLLMSGNADQAADVFALIENNFWALSVEDRLRFGLAYAPLVEERESVDAAIELLRQITRSLEARENRSKLYLLAAEILERHARFEEAAEAYGGKL